MVEKISVETFCRVEDALQETPYAEARLVLSAVEPLCEGSAGSASSRAPRSASPHRVPRGDVTPDEQKLRRAHYQANHRRKVQGLPLVTYDSWLAEKGIASSQSDLLAAPEAAAPEAAAPEAAAPEAAAPEAAAPEAAAPEAAAPEAETHSGHDDHGGTPHDNNEADLAHAGKKRKR